MDSCAMTAMSNAPASTAGRLTDAHKVQLSAIIGVPDYFGGRYRMGFTYRNGRRRMALQRIEGT